MFDHKFEYVTEEEAKKQIPSKCRKTVNLSKEKYDLLIARGYVGCRAHPYDSHRVPDNITKITTRCAGTYLYENHWTRGALGYQTKFRVPYVRGKPVVVTAPERPSFIAYVVDVRVKIAKDGVVYYALKLFAQIALHRIRLQRELQESLGDLSRFFLTHAGDKCSDQNPCNAYRIGNWRCARCDVVSIVRRQFRYEVQLAEHSVRQRPEYNVLEQTHLFGVGEV